LPAREESEDPLKEKDRRGSFEPFEPLVMAVLASGLEPWRDPERIRKSRVDLAMALASVVAGSGSVSGDP